MFSNFCSNSSFTEAILDFKNWQAGLRTGIGSVLSTASFHHQDCNGFDVCRSRSTYGLDSISSSTTIWTLKIQLKCIPLDFDQFCI